MPMILDDVLVNFDAKRVRAAAGVLCELAATGYQLLVFTCHEHIARLFEEMGVEVKELPDHAESRPAAPRRAERKARKRKVAVARETVEFPGSAAVGAGRNGNGDAAVTDGPVGPYSEAPSPPLEELAPWEEEGSEETESDFVDDDGDEEEPAEEPDVEVPVAKSGSGGAEAA